MAQFCRRIITAALFAVFSILSGAELGLEAVPWTEAGYFGSHEGNKLPQINRNLWGNPLSIGGTKFKRGLAGHTPFTVFYSLGGMARSVSGFIGLDDEDHPRDRKGEELDTTVRFVILADRKEVFRHTGKLGEKPVPFRVDLRGKQQLELRGEYGKHFLKQRVVFADPVIEIDDASRFLAFAAKERERIAQSVHTGRAYPDAPRWKKNSIQKIQYERFTNAYEIRRGPLRLVLLPELGGRLISFGTANENLLEGNRKHNPAQIMTWGRSGDFAGGFFQRPAPKRYFLPCPILMHGEYSILFPADGEVVMESQESPLFFMRYSYRLRILGRERIEVTAKIVNTAPFPQSYGIWSVTRIQNGLMHSVSFHGETDVSKRYFSETQLLPFLKDNRTLELKPELYRKMKSYLEWKVPAVSPSLSAKLSDGRILTQKFYVPDNRGLLHFYTSRMFSELEFHTREQQVPPGGCVTLKELWTLSSGSVTATVPEKNPPEHSGCK